MPRSSLAVFILIVLLLYSGLNFYIYRRTTAVLPVGGRAMIIKYLLILAILAYPVGRLLEGADFFAVPGLLITAGSLWLAVLAYLVLAFLTADLIYLFSRLSPALTFNPHKFYRWWVAGSYLITIIIIAVGYYNALHPVTRRIPLTLQSGGKQSGNYRVVFISDIHLGVIIGNGRLQRLVEKANALQPDLILLGGDIFDEDLGPVIKNNMGDLLKELKAAKGVYAVTGNHEYIGGAKNAVSYLKEHHITVLEDSSAVIDSALFLAGRTDYSSARFSNTARLNLPEILEANTKNLPVILLDHQPSKIAEAVENQVSLQLSGHTHHGQLWPFGYLTGSIFAVSRGLEQIGQSWIYVSTGYGTWGPPVRTGNRPEMVVFELEIQGQAP